MTYLDCLKDVSDFEKSKLILSSKNLIVKEYESLYIVKYDKKTCDMNDQDVKKCRGIVLEKNTNKLVCVPPPKSDNVVIFNDIDINKTWFEEFVEGTMINIFKYNGEMFMSTRSCLGGYCSFYTNKTFNTLFSEIIELSKFDVIDDNMNLTFILQHPENTIVKSYSKPDIKLVYGVSIIDNNIKHYELDDLNTILEDKGLDFGIPIKYTITEIGQVYQILEKMTYNEQGIILKYFENGTYLRGKIRNEYYNYVRHLKGNNNNKKYMYLELRCSNGLDEYLKYFQEDLELFESYRLELYETTNKLFNLYQDYYVRKDVNKEKVIKKFTDIDFEYRPLCIELHKNYKTTKQITNKQKVIEYMNSLPIAKLLFVINYKYRT